MNNKNRKITAIIAVLFDIILIITSVISVAARDWKNLLLSLTAILSLKIPFIFTYFANKKKLSLPNSFQLVAMLFIFSAQYLGEIKGFYIEFWWWDLLLHFVFGGYVVIVILNLIQGVIINNEGITKKQFNLFLVIFAFSFTIALGTLWEMFEFAGDYLFKTNMIKGGLEDTATDLLIKILAALITSIICYFHNLKSKLDC